MSQLFISRMPKMRAIPTVDITVIPGKIEDSGYSQFFGVNKVHYGLCENGEFTHLCLKISVFLSFQSEINSTFIAAT